MMMVGLMTLTGCAEEPVTFLSEPVRYSSSRTCDEICATEHEASCVGAHYGAPDDACSVRVVWVDLAYGGVEFPVSEDMARMRCTVAFFDQADGTEDFADGTGAQCAWGCGEPLGELRQVPAQSVRCCCGR